MKKKCIYVEYGKTDRNGYTLEEATNISQKIREIHRLSGKYIRTHVQVKDHFSYDEKYFILDESEFDSDQYTYNDLDQAQIDNFLKNGMSTLWDIPFLLT